jgi:hypothetical protein
VKTLPHRSPDQWYLAAACIVLFAIAFAYLIPGIHERVDSYDEAVITYGAVRVIEGDLPYRDFWTVYSPAPFYVTAALFKIFGTTILVERIWDTSMRALLAVFSYLLATRLTSRSVALFGFAAVTFWAAHYGYYSYPAFPTLGLCFAGIWMANVGLKPFRAAWLFASGLAIGMAVLYKHDFGVYCGIGQTLGLASFTLESTQSQNLKLRAADLARGFLKLVAPFAFGVMLTVLPVIVYFALRVPLNDLVNDLFTFPMAIYSRFRGLPYPLPYLAYVGPFYFPFVVFLFAGFCVGIAARERNTENPARMSTVITLIAFGLLGFNQARIRAHMSHTTAFLLPAIILLVWLIQISPRAITQVRLRMALKLTSWAMLLMILIQPLRYRIAFLKDGALATPPVNPGLERAGSAIVPPDMSHTVRYILDHTAADERIFVGESAHDRLIVNEPMIYFLAARRSATRYHDLHPGVATTAPIQQEIVDDLEKFNVRLLVLSSRFADIREPNQSAVSSGTKLLDNYIASRYRQITEFGPYMIWRRE